MKSTFLSLTVAGAALLGSLGLCSDALAGWGRTRVLYAPTVPVVAAPVVVPTTTYYAPTTTYYAPAPTVYSPTYVAPTVVAPAPVIQYRPALPSVYVGPGYIVP